MEKDKNTGVEYHLNANEFEESLSEPQQSYLLLRTLASLTGGQLRNITRVFSDRFWSQWQCVST